MTTLDLNGRWLIRHDPFNAGFLERWFERPSDTGWQPIQVPSAWQCLLGHDANGVAWYQRPLPAEALAWLDEPRARVRLRFESVATDCRAWVNGVEVGRHIGDYVPFEFDITDALGARHGQSPPTLVVRVDQVHAPRPVKGTVTENGHITKGFHDVLSLQHAGIWGSVSLRRTGRAAIIPNGLSVLPDAAKGRLKVCVEFDRDPTGLFMTFSVTDPGGEVCGMGAVTLGAGDRVWEGSLKIGAPGDISLWSSGDNAPEQHNFSEAIADPVARAALESRRPIRLWSPQNPERYTLRLDVTCGEGEQQLIEDHALLFAFRTITTGGPDNSQILLNGTPICIRGILHWGHEPAHIAPAPPPGQVREEFKRLRELGFNCVCLCMWYPPEHFYDIADETGMLLWQEHPVWKSPMGDEHLPEYQRMYEAFFRRDRRHPSVVVVSGTCEHEAFNKTLASWWWQRAHELIPDRLLQVQTAFFNWTDPDQTDLYDEHVYDNSGRWVRFLEDVQSTIKDLKPRPFVMGETIISNAWPDVEDYRERVGDGRPWWTTRGLDECARFESTVAERYGRATLDRFRRQADRFGKHYRKFQAECFRMHPRHAGWVMNHIRDVPSCRCGFKDDFENWRWTPAETLPWLADTVLLLWTPDHRRGFLAGESVPVRVGLSSFSARGTHAEACGSVASGEFTIALPSPDAPMRRPVHASMPGAPDNSWDLWVFPPPGPVPPGVIRMRGLPFTDAERAPEFEEKAYSAGWGLPCRTWSPSLPDTEILLPGAAPWSSGSAIPSGARVIVTHRLTRQIAGFIGAGGRAVLLASRHAGGMGSKFVNLYGQVPLVIERDGTSWPVPPGESDWIVDLLHHDLTRSTARAIPVQELGIQDAVDPIVRLVFTHDGGAPRPLDAVCAARVGTGLLVMSCLDHATPAGGFLLSRLLRYAAGAADLPAAELNDIQRWTVGP